MIKTRFVILFGVFIFAIPTLGAEVQTVKGYLAQLRLASQERSLNLKPGQLILLVDDLDQEYSCRVNQVRGSRVQVDCDSVLEIDSGTRVELRRKWQANLKQLPDYYLRVEMSYTFGQYKLGLLNLNDSLPLSGITLPSLKIASRFETPFYYGLSLQFGNLQDSSSSNQISQTNMGVFFEYPMQFFRLGLHYLYSANWMDTSGVHSGHGIGLMVSYELGRQFFLATELQQLEVSRYREVRLVSLGIGYQF